MKFLVDNQLPPALARFLRSRGFTAAHVRELDLVTADDRAVWLHANRNDMVVITKDEDFVYLAKQPGEPGKLVWVRLGNCRTPVLLAAFEQQLSGIVAILEQGDQVVELR